MSTSQPDRVALDPPVAAVVVLAAGGGTRMKSTTSKLLHQVGGHSLLSYAVQAAEELAPEHLVVVVGHEREQVTAHLAEIAPRVTTAVQEQQLGTGDAVRCGLDVLDDIKGDVVVTYGDVPLLTGETLIALVAEHRAHADAVTVLTAHVENPAGYGRIIRDGDQVARIVEHKDCSDDERAVDEINSGIYVFDAGTLRDGLASLTAENVQGELYLTDVIAFARSRGERVGAFECDDVWQTEGVNDRAQLATLNAEANRRIVTRWMTEGVTIADPAGTWIEAGVDLATDVTLLPGVRLQGATSIAAGALVGPDSTLRSVEVGVGATVSYTCAELAVVAEGAKVGPFARLRPGAVFGAGATVGSFVEIRNAGVGEGAVIGANSVIAADVAAGVRIKPGTVLAPRQV